LINPFKWTYAYHAWMKVKTACTNDLSL